MTQARVPAGSSKGGQFAGSGGSGGGSGGKNKSSKVVTKAKDEKPKIPKSAKLIGRARINRTNFSNPDWVKRGGWSKAQVDKVMKETEFLLHMKKSK